MSKNSSLKIFLWSPMLSNVGTGAAMLGMAESLSKYSNSKVYFIDVLGEFSKYNDGKKLYLKFLNLNDVIPVTGKISKFLIIFFSIISIPFLIKQIVSKKPDMIITGLVGFIPSLMKYLFPNLEVVNSIQGFPKFNYLRKIIWKICYKKSDYLITMTQKTKYEIEKNIGIEKEKIFVIENPIISRKIKLLSRESIDEKDRFIFKKNVYCAIGRLTRQKNFLELLKFIKEINITLNTNFHLIIIGEGEKKKELDDFIKKNDLKNCYLLGFKKNPYKYLAKSKLYISTSLWEEPGHTLLEAGYLNIPIISSNCPNGPDEIIKNEYNGLKYQLGNQIDFIKKYRKFINLEVDEKKKLTLNMKKTVSYYSQIKFCKKFLKILSL